MVNVTLKSGTNALKGESYYYLRDESLSATDFFVNRSGGSKPQLDYKRFGGSLGGPVRVPGLIDGRDRTFFFGAVEWLYDRFPEPGPQTVPTEAMRNGDFSALLAQGITIYDPATAQLVNGRVVRTPFPGNIIPANRINPIAQNVLQLLSAAEPAGRRVRTQQLLHRQPAHRRLLLDFDPRRSPPHGSAAAVRPLHPQRSPRIAQRPVRRGRRRRPDRQLPVPEERRHHRRSRLHDQQSVAAEHPRRLAAVPRAERPAARRACSIPPRSASAPRRCRSSAARSTSRTSTSTRSPTSATTWLATPRTRSIRSSRRSPACSESIRCEPATTCGCIVSSARTPDGRQGTT